MTVEASITINATKAAVWTATTDIARFAELLSGVEKIEVVERPANGLVGLKWKETRILFGKPATVEKWITEAKELDRYTTRAEQDGFVFITTNRISGSDGGVVLTGIHETRPQGFAARLKALPMVLSKGIIKKAIMQDLNDIKVAVESKGLVVNGKGQDTNTTTYPIDHNGSLDVDRAQNLLSDILKQRERDDIRPLIDEALNFLVGQLHALQLLANNYPANPISADVWMNGSALTMICDGLANELARRKLPDQEELATRLAAGMACQVMAHYPQEIFPRVFRNSHCREAIDQISEAIVGYNAIVCDFRAQELEYLLEDEELDGDGRMILNVTAQAAQRLVELRPDRTLELGSLLSAIHLRLEKP
ncbi:MAG: SRPBCC family protein [Flavobacteriales bacterium]|nr:SRPBCC family protein [Flavobacteriales bacterium]